MSEAAVLEAVETLRDEVAQLRWEIRELRRQIAPEAAGAPAPPSDDQRRKSMEAIRSLQAAILAERGGKLLPPGAPEIAAMREERAAQLAGE